MPILILALTLGAHAATPDAATPDAAQATHPVQPTAEQQAVYRALCARDQAPACADLEKLTHDPVGTYLFIIDNAQQPPWAGMRAASCLMQDHAEEAQGEIEHWVVDPATRGLGILAVDQLDQMPLAVATKVATKALTEGPDPEAMRRRIAKAQAPELRALAQDLAPNAPSAPADTRRRRAFQVTSIPASRGGLQAIEARAAWHACEPPRKGERRGRVTSRPHVGAVFGGAVGPRKSPRRASIRGSRAPKERAGMRGR